MNKNYIVLNGKHYDAVTGVLIKSTVNPSHATHTRISHPVAKAPAAHTPHSHSSTTHKSPAKKQPSRAHHAAVPKPHSGRKPEQAKTLMRHVVKKPAHPQHPTVKNAYPVAKNTNHAIVPKKSVASVDTLRAHRAQEIHKSKHVARFAAPAITPVATKIKPIAIQPAPAVPSSTKPVAAHHAVMPKDQTPAEKKTALLEQALANAKSHEQPAPKIKRGFKHRRLMSSLAGLAAVIVIGGFVAYANKASVELQLASVRAGFQASLPNYVPDGYQRQSAKAADGKVAISFMSPGYNNNFTLTQESSSWDSQTLFDTVVAHNNTTYQTVQSSGRTIYLYGGDKAAWVDGGILYKVDGNAKLNSDQIISLATSM